MKIFSFGGGVQSTAALVLAAKKEIDYNTFVFSNVGDDSENPETIDYINHISIPYAEKHGIDFVEVKRIRKNGEFVSLYEHIMRSKRTIDIPVRMSNGAPGNRNCTAEYKVKTVANYIKNKIFDDFMSENQIQKLSNIQKRKALENKSIVGIGISIDEFERMKDSKIDFIINDYPLIDMKISRNDCYSIIKSAGLPVPPKSSCYFCPYKRIGEWRDLHQRQPDLFQKSIEIEDHLNSVRSEIGKDKIFLSSRRVSLRELKNQFASDTQMSLIEAENTLGCGPFICGGEYSS
jgi:hypothetical protein